MDYLNSLSIIGNYEVTMIDYNVSVFGRVYLVFEKNLLALLAKLSKPSTLAKTYSNLFFLTSKRKTCHKVVKKD